MRQPQLRRLGLFEVQEDESEPRVTCQTMQIGVFALCDSVDFRRHYIFRIHRIRAENAVRRRDFVESRMWDGCVAIGLSAGNGCNYNHFPSSQQPRSNHDTTIFRVESKNDSDTTIPHPWSYNSDSTTRKRIREAVAESSSSWSLGEYAVPIRSDFRSTASLPPHIRVLCKRSAI